MKAKACETSFTSCKQPKFFKAMISNDRSGIVRPVLCTSRNVKNAVTARAPSTTRRSALRLSVAMAAGPLIEIYVKGEPLSSMVLHMHLRISFGISKAFGYFPINTSS